MVVLEFARKVNVVNAETHFNAMLSVVERTNFVDSLEHILSTNRSLWFTPYGQLYLDGYHVSDCSLPNYLPYREVAQTYLVTIYNRYDDP